MVLRNKQATLSQVMEQFLPLYRQNQRLSPEQASACQSIIQCQTDVLGGYVSHCDQCEHQQCYYQSCGNRHCPKCKQKASLEWENKQLESHLPVTYYHLVFTSPNAPTFGTPSTECLGTVTPKNHLQYLVSGGLENPAQFFKKS